MFTEWFMRRRGWRYRELKEAASKPGFPTETDDLKALESAFLMQNISFAAELAFRTGWLKYRDEERKRQRKAQG